MALVDDEGAEADDEGVGASDVVFSRGDRVIGMRGGMLVDSDSAKANPEATDRSIKETFKEVPKVSVRVLDLANPTHVKIYELVHELWARGTVQLLGCREDFADGKYQCLLRWAVPIRESDTVATCRMATKLQELNDLSQGVYDEKAGGDNQQRSGQCAGGTAGVHSGVDGSAGGAPRGRAAGVQDADGRPQAQEAGENGAGRACRHPASNDYCA